MSDVDEALEIAQKKYTEAKLNLNYLCDDPASLPMAAQAANDAWLEYKKAELEVANYSTMKKAKELYGC